jgi:hypothetical protein
MMEYLFYVGLGIIAFAWVMLLAYWDARANSL